MIKTIEQDQILDGILTSIKLLPLGTACEYVQIYLILFRTIGFDIDIEYLINKIWQLYNPDQDNNELLDCIKYWVLKNEPN
jgi:hypothetical protein